MTACSDKVFNLFIKRSRMRVGWQVSTLDIDSYRYHFLDNQKGDEVIVLLHGFGADKDNWNKFAAELKDSHRLIAIDLPGFGENKRDTNLNYSIQEQAKRIHILLHQLIPNKKFHIVGNSMGGAIAGTYSILFQEDVQSLLFIATAGLRSPERSDFELKIKEGINPLLVNSPEDYERLLKYIFFNPPAMPSSISEYLGERALKDREFNKKVMKDIRADIFFLEKNLEKIQSPLLVLWGTPIEFYILRLRFRFRVESLQQKL